MYWKACHCHPPLQPLQPNPLAPQQSVSCWSEQLTFDVLCFIMYADSKAPVAEKAQQFPHAPCILTSETLLLDLQSTEGFMSLEGAKRYSGASTVGWMVVVAATLVFLLGLKALVLAVEDAFAVVVLFALPPPSPLSNPPSPAPTPFNNPFTGFITGMIPTNPPTTPVNPVTVLIRESVTPANPDNKLLNSLIASGVVAILGFRTREANSSDEQSEQKVSPICTELEALFISCMSSTFLLKIICLYLDSSWERYLFPLFEEKRLNSFLLTLRLRSRERRVRTWEAKKRMRRGCIMNGIIRRGRVIRLGTVLFFSLRRRYNKNQLAEIRVREQECGMKFSAG